jgi:hypothetical protein
MSSTQRFRYVTEEIMLLENNYYEMNGADITQLIHRAWVHHLPYVLKFLFVSNNFGVCIFNFVSFVLLYDCCSIINKSISFNL